MSDLQDVCAGRVYTSTKWLVCLSPGQTPAGSITEKVLNTNCCRGSPPHHEFGDRFSTSSSGIFVNYV